MTKTRIEFQKGDRVRVARADFDTSWTFGLTGTVVQQLPKGHPFGDGLDVLVEFPAKVADGRGHNDLNYDGPENLWWVSSQNLDKTQAEVLPAPFRPGSQPSKILSHLLKGKDITNNESMLVYHIYRLSDCIHKIREAGYEVVTEIKKDEVGGKYSSYRLAAKAA